MLIFLVSAIVVLASWKKPSVTQSINPLLGDISFINKFGHNPDATTDDNLRIKTHLEFVENLLRKKNISNLPASEKIKRNHLLDLLHQYWTAGIFPRNYEYATERKPCFIDKDARICAVGYLVEQTAGRQVAEQINSKHKYEKINEMNDAAVAEWIANSGLTKEECAMIQPMYGAPPSYNYNYISPLYGISSSVLSGINISFNTINGIQISRGTTNATVPEIGLITGAGQLALGIFNLPKEDKGGMYLYTNESQKVLSMLNIGLGTTTLILSTWNSIANTKPKNKTTAWNIYNFQSRDNKIGLAFSLTRRF